MNKQKAKDILNRYTQGTASDEEIKWVESWYLHTLKNSEGYHTSNIDFEYLEKSIQHDIFTQIKPKTIKIVWYRVSAAVVLFVMLSYFAAQFLSNPQKSIAVSHGKGGAQLTLANGEVLSLSESLKIDEVVDKNGLQINKQDSNLLVFQSEIIEKLAAKPNVLATATGEEFQVVLPDGTHVWLNSQSRLTFPSSFRGKKNREVRLEGEAYFEVAHDKSHPFKVFSNNQEIKVLGTHFNVQAYAGQNTSKTTLLEGSVLVSIDNQSILLQPLEQAQCSEGQLRKVSDVDVESVIAWKQGYFVFDNKLSEITDVLQRWYDVSFVYDADVDLDTQFGGSISKYRHLEDVLSIMEATGTVHFKIEGRRVHVSNK